MPGYVFETASIAVVKVIPVGRKYYNQTVGGHNFTVLVIHKKTIAGQIPGESSDVFFF